MQDFSMVGFLVILLIASVVSIPWPRIGTRSRRDLSSYEATRKEILDDYTPAERRAMERAEAENYNKNIRAAVFWACGTTYTDYYGQTRDVTTDHPV